MWGVGIYMFSLFLKCKRLLLGIMHNKTNLMDVFGRLGVDVGHYL